MFYHRSRLLYLLSRDSNVIVSLLVVLARIRYNALFFIASQLAHLCRQATWEVQLTAATRRGRTYALLTSGVCTAVVVPQRRSIFFGVRSVFRSHAPLRALTPTSTSTSLSLPWKSTRSALFHLPLLIFFWSTRDSSVDRKCRSSSSSRQCQRAFCTIRRKNGDCRAIAIRRPQYRGRWLQAEEDAEERDLE